MIGSTLEISDTTGAGAAARRCDALVTDQLNTEWALLSGRAVPRHWMLARLAAGSSLSDALDVVDRARRSDPELADAVLLDLLALGADGDDLARRLVLQALLGRAVNLARRAHRRGASGVRGDLAQLTSAAVGAVWNSIATYPIHRRRHKVSVNLCMDALSHFTALLDDRAPETVDAHVLEGEEPVFAQHSPAPAVELLETLAWGIDTDAITTDDAALLTRVYCPGPGQDGGAMAVAREFGVAPATIRQRCRRATTRLAAAVRAHTASVVTNAAP